VAKITRDGLLINLWGDMRGFAPRSLLSTEPIEYPEKLFFIGQVLRNFIIFKILLPIAEFFKTETYTFSNCAGTIRDARSRYILMLFREGRKDAKKRS
jgi:hypothetical protein